MSIHSFLKGAVFTSDDIQAMSAALAVFARHSNFDPDDLRDQPLVLPLNDAMGHSGIAASTAFLSRVASQLRARRP